MTPTYMQAHHACYNIPPVEMVCAQAQLRFLCRDGFNEAKADTKNQFVEKTIAI